MSVLEKCHCDICGILMQEKYNEWRKMLERQQEENPSCPGIVWDCALREARESFARYMGMEQITMETMLFLEMRYEEEMTETNGAYV